MKMTIFGYIIDLTWSNITDCVRLNIFSICGIILSITIILWALFASNGIFTEFKKSLNEQDNLISNRVEIIKINNCEYLKFPINGSLYSFVHKGDCSNPIHVYNVFSNLEKTNLEKPNLEKAK